MQHCAKLLYFASKDTKCLISFKVVLSNTFPDFPLIFSKKLVVGWTLNHLILTYKSFKLSLLEQLMG